MSAYSPYLSRKVSAWTIEFFTINRMNGNRLVGRRSGTIWGFVKLNYFTVESVLHYCAPSPKSCGLLLSNSPSQFWLLLWESFRSTEILSYPNLIICPWLMDNAELFLLLQTETDILFLIHLSRIHHVYAKHATHGSVRRICSSCFVCIFIRVCWKCQRNELSAHLQRDRFSFLIETKFSVRIVTFILIARLCFVISSEFYINEYRNIVYVKNKLCEWAILSLL